MEPDTSQNNKVPSPQAPFLSSANGVKSGFNYAVKVGPGRVDMTVGSRVPDDPNLENSSLIDVGETLKTFVENVERGALDLIGRVTRVSIVSTLDLPCSNKAEANESFMKLSSMPVEVEGAEDLIFQFNKRKMVRGDTQINRLIKYETEESRLVSFKIDPQTGQPIGTGPVADARYSVLVTTDINTVPTGEVFDSNWQKDLFSEIASESKSLSENPAVSNLKE